MTGPDATLAELAQGRLRGAREGGLAVFRGVRYAAPPFGRLRFMPPEPVPPWTGERPAAAFAPASPQWSAQGLAGGPDCLALNIWRPVEDGPPRPVVVWIPGGGFVRGGAQDPLYDGGGFARAGLVFVSVNYRVGADGFLHLPDAPDNRGLLDLVAALEWVQAHIAAFGGDPDRVTAMGQSAGAGALACLLGLPGSGRWMRRAVLQSASVGCQTTDEAAGVAAGLAGLLGADATRAGFGGAPLAALVRGVGRLVAEPALRRRFGLGPRHAFPLRPVLDGRLLGMPPLDALERRWRDGDSRPELLVGSNREEMRFYLVPDGGLERVGASQVEDFVRDAGLPDAACAAAGRRLAAQGRSGAGELLCALQSDHHYRAPARRIAALAAGAGLPVRLYEFAWRSPLHGGRMGAAHGVELPFVFATAHLPAAAAIFCGDDPPAALVEAMHGAWIRFARDGEPGWERHAGPGGAVMRFDAMPACGPDACAPAAVP